MKETYRSENDFLLSAVRHGDQKAFDTLFRKYYPMLCAYGHRFVDLEDAEEIVEDSLLWIWENRETLVIESSLSSYLFKMVYRRALNKLAHIDATQRADTRFYEEMQEMLQDTDYYQMEELTKRIEEAIAALPESYRESFDAPFPGHELQRDRRNTGSITQNNRLPYPASFEATAHGLERLSSVTTADSISLIQNLPFSVRQRKPESRTFSFF